MSTADGGSHEPEEAAHTSPESNELEADVLTLNEAAAFLRFTARHTRRLAENGHIPGHKLGGTWRFSRTALLRLLDDPHPVQQPPASS